MSNNVGKLQFKHLRNMFWDWDSDLYAHNLGGITLAFVLQENGDYLVGVAVCSSDDNFNYKVGREIATKRLQTKPARITGTTVQTLLATFNNDIELADRAALHILSEKTGLQLYRAAL